MGAALGAGLGLLFGAGTGYARQQIQKRHQADQAFLDLVQKNPAVFASDPKLLSEVKKRTSPEFADLLAGIGKQSAAFTQQLSGAMGGSAAPGSGGGAPTTGGQMVAGPGAPSTAQQPLTENDHIAHLQDEISRLEKVMLDPRAAMEEHKPAIEALKQHLEFDRKQLDELTKEGRAPEVAGKRKQAELDVTNLPGNVKAEAGRKAAVEGAGASARLGVETSPAAVAGEARKAGARKKAELDTAAAAPKTPRELETEHKDVESEHKDIYTEGQKILADSTKSTTDATKMKPQVDSYNKRVIDFYTRNPSFGHPTFLTYKETPGKVYGKSATVETASPTHVIKNKSGQITGYQLEDGSIIRPSS